MDGGEGARVMLEGVWGNYNALPNYINNEFACLCEVIGFDEPKQTYQLCLFGFSICWFPSRPTQG